MLSDLLHKNTEDILEEDDEFDKEELVEMMQSIMNHVMFMSETMENFKNFFKSEDISVPFKVSQAVKSIMVLLTPVLKKVILKSYMICLLSLKI